MWFGEETLPAQVQKNITYIPSPTTWLLQSIMPHNWSCITEELAHPSTLAGILLTTADRIGYWMDISLVCCSLFWCFSWYMSPKKIFKIPQSPKVHTDCITLESVKNNSLKCEPPPSVCSIVPIYGWISHQSARHRPYRKGDCDAYSSIYKFQGMSQTMPTAANDEVKRTETISLLSTLNTLSRFTFDWLRWELKLESKEQSNVTEQTASEKATASLGRRVWK